MEYSSADLDKTLGAMINLSVDWNFTPQISLTFYVAGGRGGGVTERVYPDDAMRGSLTLS